MDCKLIQDRLIDYMDGELSKNEEDIIKEHLDNCIDCAKEYDGIKSTIDYVLDNSKVIDTNKDIKLNTNINKRKSMRRITRTGLIAVAISLVFVVTTFATDIFGWIEYWKKYSEKPINAWEQLIENGVGQKLDISTTDKDIKITAEGVISDEINTIILLRIEDLKGTTRFSPTRDYLEEPRSFVLAGDIPNKEGLPEDIPPFASFETLYSEAKNTIRLMVWTNPMDKEEGNIQIQINKLQSISEDPYRSMLNENEESKVEVQGNWNLSIPAKLIESKTYVVNEKMDIDGNELWIKNIVLAPTMTNIQFRFQTINIDKGYIINGITFLAESGSKKYGKSELSNGLFQPPQYGYSNSEYHLQSLFLEDPKDIALIVNTYSYTDKGTEEYKIDRNNLPQVIDYKGSKITIESIEYNNDNTKIIIKEDDSKDREYAKSNISLRISEKRKINENVNKYLYTHSGSFIAYEIESEIRDSKGKEIERVDLPRSEEFYRYVFKQELILSVDSFKFMDLNPDKYSEYLLPDSLYIEGQTYKKFPNSKISIKLK